MRLSGRKALVTGAGSDGIGRAIAHAFVREGADVAIHYYDRRLDEVELAEMRAAGNAPLQIQADITAAAAARSMVRDAAREMGGLDLFVANAGISDRVPFLDMGEASFDRMIAVNLRGCFVTCQEAARVMVEAGRPGRIIVVGSVNQDDVIPNAAHYCASKGGVKQLARAMALELAPHEINVNIIAPAATLTDMNREKLSDPDWAAVVANRHPKGRFAVPDDYAGAALFLGGEESAFMTGATLLIDGGYSLSRQSGTKRHAT